MLFAAAVLENQKNYAECEYKRTSQNCDRTFEYVGHALIPPIYAIETPTRQQKPERGEWRSEQDLQAQWDMSRWAFWSAVAGLVGVVVACVGIIFVKQTLDANRAAVEMAAKQIGIARNVERPYFTVVSPKLRRWDVIGQPVSVHLAVENIGKGVGFFDSYGVAQEICRNGKSPGNPLIFRSDFGRMPLRPDARWRPSASFCPFQISDEDRQALNEFSATLYVYGYVRYSDLFGVYRKTGFIFEFVPNIRHPENSGFAIHPSKERWYDKEE